MKINNPSFVLKSQFSVLSFWLRISIAKRECRYEYIITRINWHQQYHEIYLIVVKCKTITSQKLCTKWCTILTTRVKTPWLQPPQRETHFRPTILHQKSSLPGPRQTASRWPSIDHHYNLIATHYQSHTADHYHSLADPLTTPLDLSKSIIESRTRPRPAPHQRKSNRTCPYRV